MTIVIYKLQSVWEKALYQTTYAIVFKFIKYDGMINCVKSFREI